MPCSFAATSFCGQSPRGSVIGVSGEYKRNLCLSKVRTHSYCLMCFVCVCQGMHVELCSPTGTLLGLFGSALHYNLLTYWKKAYRSHGHRCTYRQSNLLNVALRLVTFHSHPALLLAGPLSMHVFAFATPLVQFFYEELSSCPSLMVAPLVEQQV
jgi:hypothetical protein